MRGKGVENVKDISPAGITPAHAGKSSLNLSCKCLRRDHPRTCGEKMELFTPVPPEDGSPPHMRGKDVGNDRIVMEHRITPAHAGKSLKVRKGETHNSDHPRTCGEKYILSFANYILSGSPPHMRGKAKSMKVESLARLDHPRTCGEKFQIHAIDSSMLGSPPHMRGKASESFGNIYKGWITPAHAGKRRHFKFCCPFFKDHPRTCGEKLARNAGLYGH